MRGSTQFRRGDTRHRRDAGATRRRHEGKFGEALPAVREALEQLAASLAPADLEERAFSLYEKFRPAIESGTRGWGQKGVLDLGKIREMARPKTG